jgi:multidrug efflux pump subunit AcrA (membrane-fusion protein)
MLVRLFFSSYSKLLAGISLAAVAVALSGCNDKVAEKPAESRPVLVATAHYESQSPERSFVGTIRPRIETDMGFRVAGKVAKRLVDVGQTVDDGQPLATLDEVDLKLQAEQALPSSVPRTSAARAGPPTRSSIRPRPPPTRRARVSIAPSAPSN